MRGKHQSRATSVQVLRDVGALLALIASVLLTIILSVAVVGFILYKAVT